MPAAEPESSPFTRFQLWHGQRTTLGPSLRATLPVQAFGGIAGGARD